jgi:uncharacterized protein YkwD
MKRGMVFIIVVVAIAVLLVGAVRAYALSPEEVKVILKVNEERGRKGFNPLWHNAQLSAAARRHSEDMATNDFWSHTGSDGSSPWDRVNEAGYTGSWRGEYLGKDYTTAESWIEGIMALGETTPSYLQILMDPLADRIGVGYQPPYWTMEIGRGGSIDKVTSGRALSWLGLLLGD